MLCIQCVNNFTLVQGQCTCLPQYYQFDSDTCLECTVGCLQCTGPAACTLCDANASFLLIGGMCECEVGKFVDVATFGEVCVPCGAMPGCVNCDMNGCIACDAILGFSLSGVDCVCNFGYYVSPMAVCTQCRIEGCLDCDTETVCVVCDNSTYYLDAATGQCLEICGDGVLFNLQCDDNNTLDGDGCSSVCTVEADFTCSGGSSLTPSACSYSGPIVFELISYVKEPTQNKVTIKAKLSPNIPLFDTVNYEECVVPSFPISGRKTVYDTNTGEITFEFEYDKSLNTNANMAVEFVPPSQDLSFYYTPKASVSLPYTTDNNLALKAYSSEVYSMLPMMSILGYLLMGLALGGFLFGLFFSSKLMGVEMLMVLQIAYLGLITIDKLESLLYPLANLWPVNGYNRIALPDKTDSALPSRIALPSYKTYFLANFNIDIVLFVLPFIVGLIVYVYARKKQEKEKKLTAFRIFKEWGMTIALTFQIHLCASIYIGLKYGVEQIYGIVIGIMLCIVIAVLTLLLVKRPNNFGEYKSFFQNSVYKSNFYVVVVVFRFLIVLGLCLFNHSQVGQILGIVVIGVEIVILIIFKPYLYNARPILNCVVMVATLAVYLGYRCRIIDETEWMTTYVPLLLLVTLFLCVVANILMMVRHLLCDPAK